MGEVPHFSLKNNPCGEDRNGEGSKGSSPFHYIHVCCGEYRYTPPHNIVATQFKALNACGGLRRRTHAATGGCRGAGRVVRAARGAAGAERGGAACHRGVPGRGEAAGAACHRRVRGDERSPRCGHNKQEL